MARLPSESFLIQQIGGQVVLFEDGSEREIVRFDPADADATARAQLTIHQSELSDEDKCFAHFWSGYFYAHNGAGPNIPSRADIGDLVDRWWQGMAFIAPELQQLHVEDLKARIITLVSAPSIAWPDPADFVPAEPVVIELPPQPYQASCPTCGMKRMLPSRWREILRATAEPEWDGLLRCKNGHEPKVMLVRRRK